MAFKDIPGIGWFVIILLLVIISGALLRHYTGADLHPETRAALTRIIERLTGGQLGDQKNYAPEKRPQPKNGIGEHQAPDE